MASRWSVASDELSCPVCRDTFKDPVLLPCSHSFCGVCVVEWWKTKRIRQCPVCKTVSSTKKPPRNLVLKNLCDGFLLEMESGVVCRQHSETLKLYCLDHHTPVCVVCRDSKHHSNHRFIPVDEAAEFYRNGILKHLDPLREKAKLFNEVRANSEKMCTEIMNQAQETETHIREEFKVLRDFLRREEETRMVALKGEEGHKRSMMEERIGVLTTEINAMESTVKSIEAGLHDDDAPFLLKARGLLEEAQRPLLDVPKPVTGALIDVAQHLGNMSYNVWYNMKQIVSYTPVILNPNTAHRELHLSEGLTSVKCGPKQPLATIPERMEHHHCVLGFEGVSSGIHSWDVHIGDNQVWALGVIAQDAHRTGDIQSGLWMVRFCLGKFTTYAPSCPVSVLPLKDRLQRVRVHLDWDKGKLSFYNPDTSTLVHTFTHTFTDTLFPYINTWNDLPLKILPVQLGL
ncbi:zinc-binding protein A33-like [Enoplosus armatus]|uniref:zinc-binding protein A33-like n=1 Tax=Enoplosus armatus TaxID=215367 RepID=UPI0039962E91